MHDSSPASIVVTETPGMATLSCMGLAHYLIARLHLWNSCTVQLHGRDGWIEYQEPLRCCRFVAERYVRYVTDKYTLHGIAALLHAIYHIFTLFLAIQSSVSVWSTVCTWAGITIHSLKNTVVANSSYWSHASEHLQSVYWIAKMLLILLR